MKKVFNLLVVDESGSMSVIRKQALAGINETLSTIKEMQRKFPEMEQVVNLLTFDSEHQTFIYDNVPAKEARKLKPEQYNPCAGTPLYDAIGKGIAKVRGQAGKDESVLVTIITDGYENSSREYDLKMVKKLIEQLKEAGWTFTFIGTDNLDVEGMARELSIEDHLAFTQSEVGTEEMFKAERQARMNWNLRRNNNEPELRGNFFNN